MRAMTGGHVVGLIVANDGGFPSQTEAALHGFEQLADGFAVEGDLHLHALISFVVHEGVGLAGFVVKVLGDVDGALVALGAEGPASAMDIIWMGTGGAVSGVAGKGLHDIDLVIPRQA